MNRTAPALYRQIGGHHWKHGIIQHLNQTYPRQRTIVCSYHNGWNYIIEDTPNSSRYLQLKTFILITVIIILILNPIILNNN